MLRGYRSLLVAVALCACLVVVAGCKKPGDSGGGPSGDGTRDALNAALGAVRDTAPDAVPITVSTNRPYPVEQLGTWEVLLASQSSGAVYRVVVQAGQPDFPEQVASLGASSSILATAVPVADVVTGGRDAAVAAKALLESQGVQVPPNAVVTGALVEMRGVSGMRAGWWRVIFTNTTERDTTGGMKGTRPVWVDMRTGKAEFAAEE